MKLAAAAVVPARNRHCGGFQFVVLLPSAAARAMRDQTTARAYIPIVDRGRELGRGIRLHDLDGRQGPATELPPGMVRLQAGQDRETCDADPPDAVDDVFAEPVRILALGEGYRDGLPWSAGAAVEQPERLPSGRHHREALEARGLVVTAMAP